MLRIGLTGGIGAGKSAVATRLAEHGAVVIDADRLAREVVAPGTPGLAAVVEAFGQGILRPDGTLDRPALGNIVFTNTEALRRLNGITHPLIGHRTVELIEAAPADAVLVHDIPLLVEGKRQAGFHLVLIVMARPEIRLARLTGLRGMPAEDAEARIAVQAGDEQRVAAGDVLLGNEGTREALHDAVDRLWNERLHPYADALEAGVPAALPTMPGPADPSWPAQFERAAARLRFALGDDELPIEQVGPVAGPDDVLDLLELRATVPDANAARAGLAGSGWVFPDPAIPVAYSADPGRPARLVLVEG